MNKPIVFSATQPSGRLTIGNYIGVISDWVKLQRYYQCMYCIADLHSITEVTIMKNNYCDLKKVSLDTLALYLACGVDPNISTVFVQSHVPEHSQLNWILNCYSYFGELNRMIQFREKSKQYKNNVNIGLFNYPVLMAADILLYQTNFVPVGSDQRQHLEFTRDIAQRFNNKYGVVFNIPNVLISNCGSRIMSLLNPFKKMSKSDHNANNYITLLDDINMISVKINRAVTDSDQPPSIYYDPINKPGTSNLLMILSKISGQSISDLEVSFKNKTYSNLKNSLIQSLSLKLKKMQDRYYDLRSDENKLNYILYIGAKKARKQASVILKKVYDAIGL